MRRSLSFAGPHWAFALAGLSALCAPRLAHADPLPTNNYQIDLFQGPLLLPIRATSLGGAYAGFGEDITGMVANAAAPAVREQAAFRHVEVDASGSFSIPLPIFENNDFDDSGDFDDDYSDFLYVTAGTTIQVGPLGLGFLSEIQSYSLTDADGNSTSIIVSKNHGLVAVSLFDGQLALGAGTRSLAMGFNGEDSDYYYAGVAPEGGLLVRPNNIPFRFGATFRMPVVAGPIFSEPKSAGDGPARTGNLTFPHRVVQPWEIEVGIAVQIGARPLNVPFIDPDDQDDHAQEVIAKAREERAQHRRELLRLARTPEEERVLSEQLDQRDADLAHQEDGYFERERARILGRLDDAYALLPRQRFLLLLSLVTSGSVDNGVSLEKFLAQNENGSKPLGVIGSSGAETNFSPRFGIEAEPIDNRLIVRAGSYYEPNRFKQVGRQHFTFGAQLKVLSTDLFGLLPQELAYGIEAGIDLAPRYESLSATITVFR